MGKGSQKRPRCISKEEENLRYFYAYSRMTYTEFKKRYEKLKEQGKIWRK